MPVGKQTGEFVRNRQNAAFLSPRQCILLDEFIWDIDGGCWEYLNSKPRSKLLQQPSPTNDIRCTFDEQVTKRIVPTVLSSEFINSKLMR
jgi:hypothetical protein